MRALFYCVEVMLTTRNISLHFTLYICTGQ